MREIVGDLTFARVPGVRWDRVLTAAIVAGSITLAPLAWFAPTHTLMVLLLGGIAALVATMRRDAVSVLSVFLVLLFLVPARWVFGPLGGVGTPAVIAGAAAFVWWAAAYVAPVVEVDLGPQPVRRVVLLFLGVMLTSFAVAMVRPLTSVEYNGAHRALVALFATAGIALLSCDGLSRRADLGALLQRSVPLAAVVAAIGVLQFATGVDLASQFSLPGLEMSGEFNGIGERASLRRPSGTALHPIEFGVVLAVMLPLAVHYARYARTRIRKNGLWTCVALIGVAIPLSLSRSALLGLGAVLLVLAVTTPPGDWRRGASIVAGSLVAVAVVFPDTVRVLFDIVVDARADPSIQGRLLDVAPVWEMISDAPWMGIGLGTFIKDEYFLTDNQWFMTAVESGIPGAVVLLAFLLVPIFCLNSVRRRRHDPETTRLAASLMASLSVPLVTLATFDLLSFKLITGLVSFLVGCSGALWRLTTRDATGVGR